MPSRATARRRDRPRAGASTSPPARSTVATISCPRTRGSFGDGSSPSTTCRSVRQTPHARTRSSTSPAAMVGTGRSAARRARPGASSSIARMSLHTAGRPAATMAPGKPGPRQPRPTSTSRISSAISRMIVTSSASPRAVVTRSMEEVVDLLQHVELAPDALLPRAQREPLGGAGVELREVEVAAQLERVVHAARRSRRRRGGWPPARSRRGDTDGAGSGRPRGRVVASAKVSAM